ncbi:hypothetical protein BDA99DRAFT_522236 [Phascolomyces articulosus]|uniref:Uncharacterized protein n=1 Tax=Phascolomyces articulosus TaxID=60185 RepID=A0AAD5P9S2_9FUNG|nr:hypothetical protein BDA99DRAFT_522236 [Phascolomyces articulosus]
MDDFLLPFFFILHEYTLYYPHKHHSSFLYFILSHILYFYFFLTSQFAHPLSRLTTNIIVNHIFIFCYSFSCSFFLFHHHHFFGCI